MLQSSILYEQCVISACVDLESFNEFIPWRILGCTCVWTEPRHSTPEINFQSWLTLDLQYVIQERAERALSITFISLSLPLSHTHTHTTPSSSSSSSSSSSAILLAAKPWEADGVVVLETVTGIGYYEGRMGGRGDNAKICCKTGVCFCVCICVCAVTGGDYRGSPVDQVSFSHYLHKQ